MSVLFSILLLINVIYFLSAGLFIANFIHSSENVKRIANGMLSLGFVSTTALIFIEARALGFYLPVMSLYQALIFFSWAMLLVYLLMVCCRLRLDTFGLVLVPLIFFLTITALLFYKEDLSPLAHLKDKWLAIHVAAAFFAYASFALSFVSAILYLVQNKELKSRKAGTFYHKLPPLEMLEVMVYRTIVLGLPLLTIALFSGFVWTRDVYGVFWRWDLKFVFSVITWVVYLAIIYTHYVSSLRGRRIVVYSMVAFCFLIFTFVGVNFFESSIHNFLR